jgi:hypothetical protein
LVTALPIDRMAFHVDETPAVAASGTTERPASSSEAARPAPLAATKQPHPASPLTAEHSRLHITVSRRFLEKLKAATAALSHAQPGADAEAILETGLDLVLERHAKRRGLVKKPRSRQPGELADTRSIPAAVRRQVWTRDGGRCAWPLTGGGTCGSTLRVELDHVVPQALGGPPRADNLRCLCRVHNQEAARRAFGSEWMDRNGGKRRMRLG